MEAPAGPKKQVPSNQCKICDDRVRPLTQSQLIIVHSTASEILQKLSERKLTACEVMEAFCGSVAIAHQIFDCLVESFPYEAIKRARELDEQLSTTCIPAGPLHELPMAIKDIHNVKGKAITWALSTCLDQPASDTDSSAVKVMHDAGVVFFAHTTMPQTGMALETVSPLWGRTLSPFNPDVFGAGGYSGGTSLNEL